MNGCPFPTLTLEHFFALSPVPVSAAFDRAITHATDYVSDAAALHPSTLFSVHFNGLPVRHLQLQNPLSDARLDSTQTRIIT